jgi:hypothetical protein
MADDPVRSARSGSETDGPDHTAPGADPDPGTRTGTGTGAETETGSGTETDTGTEAGSRDVVVPLRLYKTVTVFSTLFAIVFVLGGFILLDVATDRATADVSEIDPVVAIVGLAGIVGGAAVYAFSTRFRAEGMGKSKDESDEPSNNG